MSALLAEDRWGEAEARAVGEEGCQDALRFGAFRLLRDERCLLLHEQQGALPVRLGSRAMGLLCVLVERAGEVLGTQELLARAWPGEAVEDNTLRVHIAVLRKALGEGQAGQRFIINVPGRGYCFVGTVQRASGP